MLDGGLASVHGVKQLHEAWMKSPQLYTEGIPAGETIVLNEQAPVNGKVIEKVVTGEIPRDALVIQQLFDREYNAAVISNELKMGNLPQKQVKATEINAIQQTEDSILDSIATDLDQLLLSPCLRKAFLTILGSDIDFAQDDIVEAIGEQAAVALSRMSKGERLAALANNCMFKVHGLTATIARVREFQKFMAYLQAVQANPILLQDFLSRISASKVNDHIMKSLNINPASLGMDDKEKAGQGKRLQEIQQLVQSGITGAGNVKGASGANTGDSVTPAEINQEQVPSTGMVG